METRRERGEVIPESEADGRDPAGPVLSRPAPATPGKIRALGAKRLGYPGPGRAIV